MLDLMLGAVTALGALIAYVVAFNRVWALRAVKGTVITLIIAMIVALVLTNVTLAIILS